MVRSMGLIAVVLVVMIALASRTGEVSAVKPVDAAGIAQGLAGSAQFDLLVPSLSAEWKATSARLEPAEQDISKQSWHIGYVSPAEKYFAVEQSNTALAGRFRSHWAAGRPRASQPEVIGGIAWQVFVGNDGSATYFHRSGELLTAVVGWQSPEGQTFVAAVAAGL